MMNVAETSANQAKAAQADRAWHELLSEALRRGFYGTASVEIAVQDGTIQNIRRRLEQMER
jgi:hypothetical protein